MKAFLLKGSILGCSFDVAVKKIETGNFEGAHITGEAWGMPVDITIAADDVTEVVSATGTLLGNEFTITGGAAEEEPQG